MFMFKVWMNKINLGLLLFFMVGIEGICWWLGCCLGILVLCFFLVCMFIDIFFLFVCFFNFVFEYDFNVVLLFFIMNDV